MWTTYSTLNSTIKRKYGSSLKFVAHKNFFYETDIKHKGRDPFYKCSAEICEQHILSGDYWLVKKALVVLVFFDGLRHCESMNLVQERFSSINIPVYLYTYCTWRWCDCSRDDRLLCWKSVLMITFLQVIKPLTKWLVF